MKPWVLSLAVLAVLGVCSVASAQYTYVAPVAVPAPAAVYYAPPAVFPAAPAYVYRPAAVAVYRPALVPAAPVYAPPVYAEPVAPTAVYSAPTVYAAPAVYPAAVYAAPTVVYRTRSTIPASRCGTQSAPSCPTNRPHRQPITERKPAGRMARGLGSILARLKSRPEGV